MPTPPLLPVRPAGRALLVAAALLLAACSQKATEPLDRCKGVVCGARDACHLAGVCDGGTGTCSNPVKGAVPTVGPLSLPAGEVYAGALVQLTSPSVTLGCGPVSPGDVTYTWALLERPAGSSATLTSTTAPAPAFVPDVAGGHYLVSLTVADTTGQAAPPRTLSVDVAACGGSAPVLTSVSTPASRPAVGSSITMTATAWDADTALPAAGGVCSPPRAESFAYRWQLRSAPAGSAATGTTGFTGGLTHDFIADVAGTWEWEVTVRDGTGLVSAPVVASVATGACGPALPPLAFTGGAQVGATVTAGLAGPVTDVCVAAPLFSTRFSLVGRPAVSAAAIDPASGIFVPDRPGTYTVQAQVADQGGFASTAQGSLQVGACTAAPALGGMSAAFTEPDGAPSTALHAGGGARLGVVASPGSCGAVPVELAYQWTILSRPPGSSAALSSATASSPTLVADVAAGTWQVAVTVTDTFGNQAMAQLTLASSPCGAVAPVAVVEAGSTSTVNTYGSATLLGSASMPAIDATCPARLRGSVARLDWRLVSAPAGATATWSAQQGPVVTFSPQRPSLGTPYLVELTATASSGAVSAPVRWSVTADECGAHAPAPADGSAPAFAAVQVLGGVTVTSTRAAPTPLSPLRAVAVTANVTDLDSTTCGLPPQGLSLAWRLASVPAGSLASLSPTDALTTAFTPDLAGSYLLELAASDSTGASSITTFAVAATSSCGTRPPVVSTVTITPASPATLAPVGLSAIVTDADTAPPCSLVDPSTLSWRFTRVPAGSAAVLLAAGTLAPSFVPDVDGAYDIEVVATDSAGLRGSRTTTVTSTTPVLTINSYAVAQTVPTVPVPTVLTGLASTFYLASPIQLGITATDMPTGPSCAAVPDCYYEWRLLSTPAGSSATLAGATQSTSSFTPDRSGTYDVAVTVRRGARSVVMPLTVTVGSCGLQAPVAHFLLQPTATPGSIISLDASGSSDPDSVACSLGQSLTYSWQLVSRPPGSVAVIANSTSVTTSFSPEVVGSYLVRLTVSDGTHSGSTEHGLEVPLGIPLPFPATFLAATVDGAGLPVVATYDAATAGGRVQVWRCTAGCNSPGGATWAQVGGDVDSGLGVLTWTAGDEPRPVDVVVDAVGQIAVAYKTLTASASGIAACSIGLATFSGGAWSRIDPRVSALVPDGSGCAADGSAAPDAGRWLSLAVDTDGRLSLAFALRLGVTDYGLMTLCSGSCGLGQPAAGQVWSIGAVNSSVAAGSGSGRFIGLTPFDGGSRHMAWVDPTGQLVYAALGTGGALLSTVAVAGATSTRQLRLAPAGGGAALVWQDGTTGLVSSASCSGTCGATSTVAAAPASPGSDLALSLAPGAARLAWQDSASGQLTLATAGSMAGPFASRLGPATPNRLALVTTGTGTPLLFFTTTADSVVRVMVP